MNKITALSKNFLDSLTDIELALVYRGQQVTEQGRMMSAYTDTYYDDTYYDNTYYSNTYYQDYYYYEGGSYTDNDDSGRYSEGGSYYSDDGYSNSGC